MNWKCEDCSPRMLDYLEGSLPSGERRAFEEHTSQCEKCRNFLSEHDEAWKLLEFYPELEPSPDFVSGTMAALAGRRRTRRLKTIRMAAAAAAGLILAGSLFFFLFLKDSPGPRKPDGELTAEESELLENLDLIEDLDLLEEIEEDLDLAMEYELFDILSEGENL